jgi:hypothetical protein
MLTIVSRNSYLTTDPQGLEDILSTADLAPMHMMAEWVSRLSVSNAHGRGVQSDCDPGGKYPIRHVSKKHRLLDAHCKHPFMENMLYNANATQGPHFHDPSFGYRHRPRLVSSDKCQITGQQHYLSYSIASNSDHGRTWKSLHGITSTPVMHPRFPMLVYPTSLHFGETRLPCDKVGTNDDTDDRKTIGIRNTSASL